MLLAVDVHYEARAVVTACVGFASWQDATTALEWVHRDASEPAPYEPGQFYKRELRHVLRAISEIGRRHPIDTVVVDAHVCSTPAGPVSAATCTSRSAAGSPSSAWPRRRTATVSRCLSLAARVGRQCS
jgi:hypothetical protein